MSFTLRQRRHPGRVAAILGGRPSLTTAPAPRASGIAVDRPGIAHRPAPPPEVSATVAAEAAEKARADGEARGYEVGLDLGYKEGMAKAEEVITEAITDQTAELQAAIAALTTPWDALRDDLADSITDAAIRIAGVISSQIPEVDTGALRRVVEGILAEASQSGAGHRHLTIHVCPENAKIVAGWAADAGARVIPDKALGPAEVTAELARDDDAAYRISWDATLKSQWQAIRQTLGLGGADS